MDDGSLVDSPYPPYPAVNYDPLATIGDMDSCQYCADSTAYNFDYAAYPSSLDACLYCPNILPSIVLDNATENSFDITWTHPTDAVPSYAPVSDGDSGVDWVTIYWGKQGVVPPYTTGQAGNPGGGSFQYSPHHFDNGSVTYNAITDNGDGTLTITVSLGQFSDGVIMGAPGIIPDTTYQVAVDTTCINNPSNSFSPPNTILYTDYINSNTVTGVNITTPPTPVPTIPGCFNDPTAINFMCPSDPMTGNPNSPVPCTGVANGGIDPLNGQIVNTDDGSCTTAIPGCIDNGSCGSLPGQHDCWDYTNLPQWSLITSPFNGVPADNYDSSANVNNGTCEYTGCTDPTSCAYDAGYTVPCVDSNGVSNGTAGNTCCGVVCGDPMGLNYSGITDYACIAGCQYCGEIPNAPGGSPADGMGIIPTWVGPATLDANGNTYIGLNIETSFPAGYDFSIIQEAPIYSVPNYPWHNIKLKVRDVTGWNGAFPPPSTEVYYMQIPNTFTGPDSTALNFTFPAFDSTSSSAWYHPELHADREYEFAVTVICDSPYYGAIGASWDMAWQYLDSFQ
jgi:hypothetical protein